MASEKGGKVNLVSAVAATENFSVALVIVRTLTNERIYEKLRTVLLHSRWLEVRRLFAFSTGILITFSLRFSKYH